MLKKIWAKILHAFGYKKMGTVTMSAVVTRADGTVEDLGVVAKGKVDMETVIQSGLFDPEGEIDG